MKTTSTIKTLAMLGVGVLAVAVTYLHFESKSKAPELQGEPLASAESMEYELSGEGSTLQPAEEEILSREPVRSEMEQLLMSAYGGDPTSISAAHRLVNKCSAIEGNEFELLEANRAMEMPEFYMTHLENLFERCNELSQIVDFNEAKPELETMLAESQPVYYQADQLVKTLAEEGIARADEIAQEVLLSRNGSAIQHLGSYFLYADSFLPPPSVEQARARIARDNAIDLMSCKYGWAECERGSVTMLNQCAAIKSESCFRNLDLVGYLETYSWSPAERQDAYETLREFELMISEGKVMKIIQFGRN